MDVRCEKCQTEYELDESRLKPGGVTVKCTNCGHMFKIRKRTPTNVGMPVADAGGRARQPSKQPLGNNDKTVRADSMAESMMSVTDQGSGPTGERQWMVRLENGETKTCRELAVLQQWIVAGIVTRESLISRSGKTWKRLGDIAELGQYFVIADEARAQRAHKPTPSPKAGAATMLGVAPANVTDDDIDQRSTGNFRSRTPTPPPPPPRAPTPAIGSPVASQPTLGAAPKPATPAVGSPQVNPLAQTEISAQMPAVKPPAPGRATAAWASNEIKHSDSMAAMPQGPRGGRLSASPDEPAFAGRVRLEPGAESSFQTGRVRLEDDDDMIAGQRGSRAGMWIALLSLLVIGAAAGAVYMFVFRKHGDQTAAKPAKLDAGVVAVVAADASLTVTPVPVDAAPEVSPIDQARGELLAGVEARMKTAADGLAAKDDPASLAMRARLLTALAQSMNERAGLVEKAEGDKLRKDAKQIVIDAAPLAQRAFKSAPDDPGASLAMADVLRLQGKPAKDVQRYLETAKPKAAADASLGSALVAMRDGKLDDAHKQLAAIDAPDDQRVKIALALIAQIQNKAADAKPIVDQILATQPDHETAKALAKKLETSVAKSDPLPPEDNTHKQTQTQTQTPVATGGTSYDALLASANKLAETNCTKALDLYSKALEQKPNGVEALTGMGYCNLDAKQFSSAFSKFRAALAVSPKYEPALGGIAETYQRQGNKEQAIEAWHRYLDAFPGSPKAKKQLEILGDTGGASSEQPKPPPPADPVKPPQDKPVAPTPTGNEQPQKQPDPAAGSGSG